MSESVNLDITTTEEIVTVTTNDSGTVTVGIVAGNNATVTVGTTTTGAAGTNASVTNSGTSSAAVFNFTIPRGDKGEAGDAGPNSVTSATTSDGTAQLDVISINCKNDDGNTLFRISESGFVIYDSSGVFQSTFTNPLLTANQVVYFADESGKVNIGAVKSANFTAADGGSYITTATLTVADPTPSAGASFSVFVRNGTATVGGTAYSTAGTQIVRVYHSGAWVNYVFGTGGGGSVAVGDITGLGTGVATALAVNVGTTGAFAVTGSIDIDDVNDLTSQLNTIVTELGSKVTENGALGTPASGTLTSCTGLPISTGVSGLGTGVATALAVNTGSAGAVVLNGGTATNMTLAGTLTINSTTYTYGTGAAAAHRTALGTRTVKKASNTSRASTTTETADPDLQLSVVANQLYRITLRVLFTSGAGGFKYLTATPTLLFAGATAGNQSLGVGTTPAGTLVRLAAASTTSMGAATEASATTRQFFLTYFVEFTASGTVSFNWSQNSSNVADTTVLAGSSLTIEAI